MPEIPYKYIYDLKISLFNRNQLDEFLITSISQDFRVVCYGYSLASIYLMRKHHCIYYLGNSSDIMLTDGRVFYLLLKLLAYNIPVNLSIPNLVNCIIELADKHKYSILLLGADQLTNDIATENIRTKYKDIITYKGINGYFNVSDEINIVKKINDISPDILLIGISTPKKEEFVLKWRNSLKSKIIIPCGGMIDVIAGKTKQTPPFLKKIGLASLFRLVQEPKRLFKRQLAIYFFILFRFIPVLFWKTIIKREKGFSIAYYYGIK
jgi:N-acetylglucosaminyldiphosphoundecaprenol N-acetyl-beta-D-mannosaminyltransferase